MSLNLARTEGASKAFCGPSKPMGIGIGYGIRPELFVVHLVLKQDAAFQGLLGPVFCLGVEGSRVRVLWFKAAGFRQLSHGLVGAAP